MSPDRFPTLDATANPALAKAPPVIVDLIEGVVRTFGRNELVTQGGSLNPHGVTLFRHMLEQAEEGPYNAPVSRRAVEAAGLDPDDPKHQQTYRNQALATMRINAGKAVRTWQRQFLRLLAEDAATAAGRHKKDAFEAKLLIGDAEQQVTEAYALLSRASASIGKVAARLPSMPGTTALRFDVAHAGQVVRGSIDKLSGAFSGGSIATALAAVEKVTGKIVDGFKPTPPDAPDQPEDFGAIPVKVPARRSPTIDPDSPLTAVDLIEPAPVAVNPAPKMAAPKPTPKPPAPVELDAMSPLERLKAVSFVSQEDHAI